MVRATEPGIPRCLLGIGFDSPALRIWIENMEWGRSLIGKTRRLAR